MIFSRALLSPARRAAKVSISSRALSGFGKLPASRCSASTRNFVAKNCSSVNSIHSTPWCYCMLLEDHKVFLRIRSAGMAFCNFPAGSFVLRIRDRILLVKRRNHYKKKNICCPFAGRDSLRHGTADVFLFYDAVRFTPQWAWSGRTSPQWPCGSGRRTASPGRQRCGLPAPNPYLRGNCG